MFELRGDRGPGDDVIAGHHPHPDVRLLGVGDRGLGLLARRVDHPDQAGHLQVLDQGEQIAVRVEAGRVEIPDGAGHDPQARLSIRWTCCSARCLSASSQGTLVPLASAVAARAITAGAAPLTKQRTTSLPDASLAWLKVAISL